MDAQMEKIQRFLNGATIDKNNDGKLVLFKTNEKGVPGEPR